MSGLGLLFSVHVGGGVGRPRSVRRVARRSLAPIRAQQVSSGKYTDYAELEKDLREYLETRAADENMEEELREDGGGAYLSPLAYTSLAKAGRFDLLEGVMQHGGYLRVAEQLGLEVIIPEKPKKDESTRVVFRRTANPGAGDGFLTLGGAKAERLSEEGVSKGIQLGKERDEERRLRQRQGVQKSARAETRTFSMMRRFANSVEEKEQKPPGEGLQLNVVERLELVFEMVFLAAAFGRLGQDLLSAEVRQTLQNMVFGGFAFHVLLGVYARSLAMQKNRDPVLWFAKVSVIGAGSLLRLRLLPSVPPKNEPIGEALP